MIASPVGPSRPNRAADVRAVQMLLNGARPQMPGQRELRVDGLFGPETAAAISRYRANVLRFGRPDGVVDPGGPTLRGLGRQVGRPIATGRRSPSPAVPVRAAGQAPTAGGGASVGGLTEAQFVQMAAALACEIAAIKAVVATEAVRGAFDEQGRPTILGENHVAAGHATVEALVDAMKRGTAAQTTAFLKFVRNDSRLLSALRARNWATFARIYNGPGYRENNYDGKMRSNYLRYARG